MLTIIIAIFIIALIAALAGGFLCVRKKTRKMSHALFGTEHLLDGIEKANLENASRPKSIAAMTRLVLPRITADFPDFSYPEMKNRAENLLTSYLRAIHENGTALIIVTHDPEIADACDTRIEIDDGRVRTLG